MPITLTTKANERGTFVIIVSFKDEIGAAEIPATVAWTLTDSDGTVINSRSSVTPTPAASINIVLYGDDLALPSSDLRRIVYISGTYDSSYGSGLPLTEEIEFEIEPLVNAS